MATLQKLITIDTVRMVVTLPDGVTTSTAIVYNDSLKVEALSDRAREVELLDGELAIIDDQKVRFFFSLAWSYFQPVVENIGQAGVNYNFALQVAEFLVAGNKFELQVQSDGTDDRLIECVPDASKTYNLLETDKRTIKRNKQLFFKSKQRQPLTEILKYGQY